MILAAVAKPAYAFSVMTSALVWAAASEQPATPVSIAGGALGIGWVIYNATNVFREVATKYLENQKSGLAEKLESANKMLVMKDAQLAEKQVHNDKLQGIVSNQGMENRQLVTTVAELQNQNAAMQTDISQLANGVLITAGRIARPSSGSSSGGFPVVVVTPTQNPVPPPEGGAL